MILCITLNPCFDRTIYVDRLVPGGAGRVQSSRNDVCGKGVNVAVALRQLGAEPFCLGLSFLDSGNALESALDRLDIPHSLTRVPGEMRTNYKIFDESSKEMTECNEQGAEASPQIAKTLLEGLQQHLEGASLLVLSGSVPPGMPVDIYKQMILLAKQKGVPAILDASGEALLCGLEAAPAVAKPNKHELEAAAGTRLRNLDHAVEAARQTRERWGIGNLCLSIGGEGAVMAGPEGAWFCPAAKIPIRGTQGAGDSMVAGMCLALERNLPSEGLLRYAVAAAQASLLREGTLMCTAQGFAEMLPLTSALDVSHGLMDLNPSATGTRAL